MCQAQVLCRHHRHCQHHQVCPLRQGNETLYIKVCRRFNFSLQAVCPLVIQFQTRRGLLRQYQYNQECPLYPEDVFPWLKLLDKSNIKYSFIFFKF